MCVCEERGKKRIRSSVDEKEEKLDEEQLKVIEREGKDESYRCSEKNTEQHTEEEEEESQFMCSSVDRENVFSRDVPFT